MKKPTTLCSYFWYGYLMLVFSTISITQLRAQLRSDANTLLKNAEQAWCNFTEGRERQDPQTYEEAAQNIQILLKEVDEFSPSETKLWQAKSTILKVYSIWLIDVYQHQWIVPLSEKKATYQNFLAKLGAQNDIKILRSQNLFTQSLVHYALKDFKTAEKLCKEALSTKSKNPYFLQRLGKIYTQQEKYTEAEQYIKQSLELSPNNEEALGELSYIYLQTSREEEALALINKALNMDSDYFRNLTVLAIILADKGQTEESQQLYAKIRTLQPYYTFAYTNDVHNYLRQKDYPAAIQILDTLLQKNPYNSRAWSLMGDICTYQNKSQEAIQNYEKCNEIDNSCLSELGYQHYKENNYQKALEYYQQALSLDNTNKYAHHWSGWCYLLTNQYKKAIISFENATQLDNQYAYAYNGLGTTYELLSDYHEAILMYERAIAANAYNHNNSDVLIGKVCALYARELLEEQKIPEAIKYLQIGGKYQRHCQALAAGLCYENGVGLPQNYTSAYQHYRQAAERHPYTAYASNYILALYENQKIAMDSLDYQVWKAIASTKALRLTIPINSKDQSGENASIFLYEDYPDGALPPTWEAQRLQEEKNFSIPEDVSESLRKLYELAKKNKVSYIGLTKYALEMANE